MVVHRDDRVVDRAWLGVRQECVTAAGDGHGPDSMPEVFQHRPRDAAPLRRVPPAGGSGRAADPVEDVAAQAVAFGECRVVEVVAGVPVHADLLHHVL